MIRLTFLKEKKKNKNIFLWKKNQIKSIKKRETDASRSQAKLNLVVPSIFCLVKVFDQTQFVTFSVGHVSIKDDRVVSVIGGGELEVFVKWGDLLVSKSVIQQPAFILAWFCELFFWVLLVGEKEKERGERRSEGGDGQRERKSEGGKGGRGKWSERDKE